MKAVVLNGFGGPEVLAIGDVPAPAPGPGQVLVDVAATSVNRPDLIQREGHYPPPPGASEIPGLEIAGTIAAIGGDAGGWRTGQRIMALVPGGGYAAQAVVDAGHLIPIPDRLDFEQAACICECYITAYLNLFMLAGLGAGQSCLLHGGGGGVNTAAIQIVRALVPDATILVTASPGKLDRVAALGVDAVIDYRSEDFAVRTAELTDKRGVDVILDHIGADYFEANLKSLAVNGRLVVIAVMSGRHAAIDLARLMIKRQTVIGSVLRPRPPAEKADIIARFRNTVMPLFESGEIEPVIDRSFPLEAAPAAHAHMEAGAHFGKIVLTVD